MAQLSYKIYEVLLGISASKPEILLKMFRKRQQIDQNVDLGDPHKFDYRSKNEYG
jgi:hypothetical protein